MLHFLILYTHIMTNGSNFKLLTFLNRIDNNINRNTYIQLIDKLNINNE